jgi:hypothetical protein
MLVDTPDTVEAQRPAPSVLGCGAGQQRAPGKDMRSGQGPASLSPWGGQAGWTPWMRAGSLSARRCESDDLAVHSSA